MDTSLSKPRRASEVVFVVRVDTIDFESVAGTYSAPTGTSVAKLSCNSSLMLVSSL